MSMDSEARVIGILASQNIHVPSSGKSHHKMQSAKHYSGSLNGGEEEETKDNVVPLNTEKMEEEIIPFLPY